MDTPTDLQMHEKAHGCNCNGNLLSDFLIEANLQAKALEILEGMDQENSALRLKLNDEVLLCKEGISTCKQELESYKLELAELRVLSSRIEELTCSLDYLENNIPQHFSSLITNQKIVGDTSLLRDDGIDDNDGNGSEGASYSPSLNSSPDTLLSGSFIQSPAISGTNSPIVLQKKVIHYEMQTPAKPVNRMIDTMPFCPTVAYLTQEEFDSIPNYMRGRIRLTYIAVNEFIDTFNTALNKKYKILSQPASSLRLQEKQLHLKYKKQENKETKGLYFITEEDIKNLGQVKAMNTGNSLMAILRSCRRMHEVRGQGIVRFAVITGN